MKVLTVNYQHAHAAQDFSRSLKETGFAVLSAHPISASLVNGVYQEWQDFFNSEDKFNYLFDREKQDGYFPFRSENAKDSPVKDLKEFFHVYSWGRFPKQLGPATHELFQQLTNLASTLLEWVEHETPASIRSNFSMPLPKMIEKSPQTLLRILHYPPLTGSEEEGAVRAGQHEDINLITLLPAATATGLQVLDARGQWHDVDCDPGTIVVNSGDMLQMCTEGYYRSTTHRVVNPKGEEASRGRMSMPLFLHPRAEVLLAPGRTAQSYLIERLTELGLY